MLARRGSLCSPRSGAVCLERPLRRTRSLDWGSSWRPVWSAPEDLRGEPREQACVIRAAPELSRLLLSFQTPHCITEEKWSVLSEKEASPAEVARAVVEIVVQLKRAMISHTKSHLVRNKYKKLRKRNKHSREPAEQQATDTSHTTDSSPAPSVKPTVSFRALTRWQRIVNYFRNKSTS